MAKIIYFINDYKNDLFNIAYTICTEKKLQVQSISEKNLISKFKNYEQNSFFVFCKFEGYVFTHLKSLKMNIFGPSVILYCINENIALPSLKYPIYSFVMKNIKISTSKIDKNNQIKLFNSIEMMGGHPCRDLTSSVNVLLTEDVTSSKYHMAHTCKMMVLKPEWIYHIWSLCSTKIDIDLYNDTIIKLYNVPALYNLNICLSGFSVDEKQSYINLINLHGGRYCPSLKNNVITVLISQNTLTDKYKSALSWNFNIVTVAWLKDSISKGFCQHLSEYKIKCDKINFSSKKPLGVNTSIMNEANNSIFINCRICFIACNQAFINKWSYIIKSRGGIIIETTDKNITHIIAENEFGFDTSLYKNIIRKDWLDECLKKEQLLPLEKFLINNLSLDDSWIYIDENEQKKVLNLQTNDVAVVKDIVWQNSDDITEEDMILLSTQVEEDIQINRQNNDVDSEEMLRKHDITNNSFNDLTDDFFNLVEEDDTILFQATINNEETSRTTTNDDGIDDFTAEELEMFSEIENNSIETLPSTSVIKKNIFKNCLIAFLDCQKNFVEKWKKIINDEGGRTCLLSNDSTSLVTHVIVNDYNTFLESRVHGLYIAKEWLEISLRNEKLHPTEDFLVQDVVGNSFEDDDDWGYDDIEESSISTVIAPMNETIIFNNQSTSNGLFKSLKFFLDKTLSESSSKKMVIIVTNNSGKISDKPDKCNYIVTSLIINHPYKCLESVLIVTEYFILQCVSKQMLLTVGDDFLFQPLLCDENCKYILSKCVLCIKGFSTEEMVELKYYSASLGAIIQNEVIKGGCGDNTGMVTTHIVAKEINDDLIETKGPIISKFWLEKCGRDRCFVNVSDFLLKPDLICEDTLENNDLKPLSKASVYMCDIKVEDLTSLMDAFINLGGKLINCFNIEVATHVVCNTTLSAEDMAIVLSINTEIIHLVNLIWFENSVSQKKLLNDKDYIIDIKDLQFVNSPNEPMILCRDTNLAKNMIKRNNSSSIQEPLLKKQKSFNSMNVGKVSQDVSWNYKDCPVESNHEFNVVVINSQANEDVNDGANNIKYTQNKDFKSTKVSVAINVVPIHEEPKKIFIVYPVKLNNKDRIKTDIEILGGELVEEAIIKENITHLIISAPNRSEMCLSSIAGGKWILHPSYIYDSAEKGIWLNEELYEWGNPLSKHIWKKIKDPLVLKMSYAGYKWRKKGGQIFANWKVLLVDLTTKAAKIANIFHIGGAQVITRQPHEVTPEEVTHAFYKSSGDLIPQHILPLCFKWLKLELIPTYISEVKPPEEKTYLYPSSSIKEINNKINKQRDLIKNK